MQDRYAGDIGDYAKLALLRALAPGYSLGIGWYRTIDGGSLGDGRHIGYLRPEQRGRWRKLDPELHDLLARMIASGERSITALEAIPLGSDAAYHDVAVASPSTRAAWFSSLKETLRDRDLVFFDPDNGIDLGETNRGRRSGKSITLDEIAELSRDRIGTLVYHHQTRRTGGHLQEIADIGRRLHLLHHMPVCAVRAGMWSPRVFFLLSHDGELVRRAEEFATNWSPGVTFHRPVPATAR